MTGLCGWKATVLVLGEYGDKGASRSLTVRIA